MFKCPKPVDDPAAVKQLLDTLLKGKADSLIADGDEITISITRTNPAAIVALHIYQAEDWFGAIYLKEI